VTNQGHRMGRGNRVCIESMEVESSKWDSQLPLALCKVTSLIQLTEVTIYRK